MGIEYGEGSKMIEGVLVFIAAMSLIAMGGHALLKVLFVEEEECHSEKNS
jgi:hypothetical protein